MKVNQLGITHFLIVCMCVLMQMLDFGELYRFFAHLNLLIVITCYWNVISKFNSKERLQLFSYFILVPLIYLSLNFLAGGDLEYSKEIRRIILAIFLGLSIWLLALSEHDVIKKNSSFLILVILFLYVIIQAVALWVFHQPYGIVKNPHILAFYSAIALITAIYYFFQVAIRLRLFLVMAIIILGTLLLHSSSRPVWIGLISSGFLVLLFLEKKVMQVSAITMIILLSGLILTNAANFLSRFRELIVNIGQEERVVIWQDTWMMQMDSSYLEWLLGHGISAFKMDFVFYSQYHLDGIDFNSPHNFILDLLYGSGIVGLLLFLFVIFHIYNHLFIIIKHDSCKNIALLLLAVISTNIIADSITVQFFSTYNLNIIAIVVAIMLLIDRFYKVNVISKEG